MGMINLTPHEIAIRTPNGDVRIAPTQPAARVSVDTREVGEIYGIPVVVPEYGPVENLPEPVEGVLYITSTLVAQTVRRSDVMSPDTGATAIRENGQIVAVTRLQSFPS